MGALRGVARSNERRKTRSPLPLSRPGFCCGLALQNRARFATWQLFLLRGDCRFHSDRGATHLGELCQAGRDVVERADPSHFCREHFFVGGRCRQRKTRDQLLQLDFTLPTLGQFPITFNPRHALTLSPALPALSDAYLPTICSFLWQVLQRTRIPTRTPHLGQRAALRASFNFVRGR